MAKIVRSLFSLENGKLRLMRRKIQNACVKHIHNECYAEVPQGRMKGRVCVAPGGRKFYSFEGIPYAKPPVGRLGFQSPQKLEGWPGILDATKPGNKCKQVHDVLKIIEGSEDCLYLNVYTPSLPKENVEKLPVLFLVHGGRLVDGFGAYYRPDYILSHDVILVSINYRINIFGFLCLHTPEVPGNAGLKDTAMALRWVRDNIGHFNGDSDNIVPIGESAGASVVTSYLMSPMTRGLFSKVIAQSMNVFTDLFVTLHDPVEKASRIASIMRKNLTKPNDLFDFFSKASADDMIRAHTKIEYGRDMTDIHPFLIPVVEKQFDGVEPYLVEYPLQSVRNNRFDKVPVLMTMETHEGGIYVRKDATGKAILNKELRKFIPYFTGIDKDSERAFEIEKKLKKYYFGDKEIDQSQLEQYLNMFSDVYFMRDIIYGAELLADHSDVYFLRFAYVGNMNTRVMKNLGIKGTSHGDILQYLFYKDIKAKLCKEKDMEVIDTVTQMWSSFAKSGQPSWKNQNVKWLPYRKNSRYCLNIDEDGTKYMPLPEYERNKFVMDLLCERPLY
ncbi:unnamed protein product [Leptosia nina]|uniref:Carboxylesterase type B domain-containing protein n=1 Tax=Leptosia nina TaxID=320188 RepID=A0AAV1JAU8_9NEOP